MTLMKWSEEQNALEEYEKRMDDSVDWFKPEANNQYKIKFLTEGEPFEFEYDGKLVKKVLFRVLVGSTEFKWGVTKGLTKDSLFGQIVQLANLRGGVLKDSVMSLLVKGEKMTRQYAVLDLIKTGTAEAEKE